MRLILIALARTPLPLLYVYGWIAYLLAFHVFRWRRAQVAGDLALAFPEKSDAERAEILQQSYRQLADVSMEMLWGFRASAETMKRRVVFDNPEVIRQGADAGQSVVLLAPHFCNWEWLLSAGAATFEFPIDAVYQTLRVKSVDLYLKEARSRFGGKPIPRDEFIYELMSRAGSKQGYALIADQTPRREDRKHWTRLVNRDTAFFVGAEKVARFLDCKVLYVGMRRVKRGHYSVHFTVLGEPPYDRGDERADYSPVMEGFARTLEAAIHESPADWLWVQKRWKYPKPATE